MAADQFRCSVCLEVFTDPVTVPCGHNFCKSCIAEQRTLSAQLQCPTCEGPFDTRPDLKTFVSQVAANLRSSARRKARSFSQRTLAIPDPVLCDVCAESKKKAVKSCLECLTSYCETHLEPHQKIAGLRRHKLTSPVDNLEDRVCRRHERPLEMFCRTDQMCVCPSCAMSDHKKHRVVSLIKEYKGKKKDVEETEARVQRLIQERLLKMEQIKQSLKLSKDDAEEVTAAVVQRCATLIKSTRKSLDQLVEVVEQKQKTTEEQAEGLIKELEEEIAELVEKSSELKQLSQTEDHFQLLQNRTSLQIKAKDWTNVQPPSSCDGTVRKAVEELEALSKLMKTLYADVELLRARLYAVDVTLDGDTANPYLILSDDGKRVVCGDVEQDLPEKPERLSSFGVLGEQSFSSGKFYYEVQVEGKTKWELGVVRGSINRKGQNTICPENGYWALWLRDGHYRALTGPSVPLFLTSRPQKVGVFVDYDEGVVSFYDADAALLVYSFTGCEFTEKLHPYFSPCPSDGGKNSTPLIISTIRQTR